MTKGTSKLRGEDDEYARYRHCGGGFTGTHISQNSSECACALNIVPYYVSVTPQ